MKVAVSSFKFSPGHLSHMIAYAKLFKETGCDVVLWLDEEYKQLVTDHEIPIEWYPQLSSMNFDVVFLANVSMINHLICKKLKKKGTKIIYLYHEPWESFRAYLKEGIKQTLKATVAHHFSVKTLKLSDLVIVPSNYALNLYRRKDIKYNKNVVVIPLLFDDETNGKIDPSKKEFFSYIGHAVKGHAFDLYINLIKYMYKQSVKIKYEVATRIDLSELLKKDKILQKMIEDKVLKISHGKPLTNEEINRAYKMSFCVWNIYRRSTQSGVLPKAYMFGTPVIASNIGSFPEFVLSGKTGQIISIEEIDYGSLIEQLMRIKENIKLYSNHARRFFLRVFHYKSYVKKMQEILQDLQM
ncbi:glycosyltransferase [Thermotoga sp. KOL6]|uniref:glycosyltransferase n=1 Tax=Thermotoga sp. KOL6 TaxID=126741 RepID=UPI000C76D7A9|nr:glycosyltransferase [Thermotoga sp. KOL6]PLV59334.1 glycosyl transferase family 1 [Thermotoga sp. KOL6]